MEEEPNQYLESLYEVLQSIPRINLEKISEYIEEGFNLSEVFHRSADWILEIGGPTDSYWFNTELLRRKRLAEKFIIANISDEPGIDLLADGGNLPIRDKSADIVLFSSLPLDLMAKTMLESYRILKDDGLLIIQNYWLTHYGNFKLKELIIHNFDTPCVVLEKSNN